MRTNNKTTPAAAETAAIVANPAAEVAETATLMVVATEPEPATEPAQQVPPVAPTLTQIQDKVKHINTVAAKVDFLVETATKLESFGLGRSGVSDALSISDGSGNRWTTSKTEIVQKVLDMLKAELAQHLSASEAELRAALAA